MSPCFANMKDGFNSSDSEEGDCIAQSDVRDDVNELKAAGNLEGTMFASNDWHHNGKQKIENIP